VRFTQTDCGKRWKSLGETPKTGIKAKTPASFAGASGEKRTTDQQEYFAKNNFSSRGPKGRQWVISNDAGRVKDVLILFYLMGSLVFPR
jgi:hypothetical protein